MTILTGTDRETVVLPWVKVASEADARKVAARIRHLPYQPADFTCLTHMLRTVADKFVTQIPEPVDRIVLDV